MPEEDTRIFGEAYEIYNKWRWKKLDESDWIHFAEDLGSFSARNDWQNNPLTKRLTDALFDVFGDMYRNGATPAMPDYFGRSDL